MNDELTFGWCFVDSALHTRDDITSPTTSVGETITISDDEISAFALESMLFNPHGTRDLPSALRFGYGTTLCRFEAWGRVLETDSNIVAKHRRIIEAHDVTDELKAFIKLCALQVVQRFSIPEDLIRYLEGDADLNIPFSKVRDLSLGMEFVAESVATTYYDGDDLFFFAQDAMKKMYLVEEGLARWRFLDDMNDRLDSLLIPRFKTLEETQQGPHPRSF